MKALQNHAARHVELHGGYVGHGDLFRFRAQERCRGHAFEHQIPCVAWQGLEGSWFLCFLKHVIAFLSPGACGGVNLMKFVSDKHVQLSLVQAKPSKGLGLSSQTGSVLPYSALLFFVFRNSEPCHLPKAPSSALTSHICDAFCR